MSALKPEDIVFSLKKPYLLAYSFFSSPEISFRVRASRQPGKTGNFFSLNSPWLHKNSQHQRYEVYRPRGRLSAL